MPNTLSPWDPQVFANEALMALNKSLGLAGRVYRQLDKTSQELGTTITIKRPQTFVASDEPSTEVPLAPGVVSVTFDQWKGVKIALTDKELTLNGQQVFDEHVEPMAIAIADAIDLSLAGLYKDIPWIADVSSPAAISDITNARKILFNNRVPMRDLGLMVDGTVGAELRNIAEFNRADSAGQAGEQLQREGDIGRKFGFDIFENQNVQTHTAGVAADSTGTLTGAHSAGATTISAAAMTIAGTFKKGDTLVIAGNAQRYAITADITLDGAGAHTAIPITPALVQDYLNAAVVTVTLQSGAQQIAFHKNAFALAMAPLSTMGEQVGGAQMGIAVDPITKLALRARKYYVGETSKVYMALDALWARKTLDPNLAVRLRDA